MHFTLTTWNVLATAYIQRAWYPRSPRKYLDPAWRVPALVRHAKQLGSDILCLQEVEPEVFAALAEGLGELGYLGKLAMKGAKRPDGCATFFRGSAFTLLDDRRLAYADNDAGAASGNIAQFLILGQEGKRLAVVNTHLKWDPPKTPRERQLGYRQISQVIEALRLEEGSSIVCGDFNVSPESDVIEAMLEAGFDYTHRDCPGVCTCNSNNVPKLIDHLFYRGSLRASPRIPLGIDELTALPSEEQPSDHLPLTAEFDWNI